MDSAGNLTMAWTSDDNNTSSGSSLDDDLEMTYASQRGADNKLLWLLVVYAGPVLMLVGTLGNILTTVVILKTPELYKRNTSVYLLVLALVDTLALDLRLADHLFTMFGLDARTHSRTACKMVVSTINFLCQFEAWVLINMAVERVSCVVCPSHHKRVVNAEHNIGIFLVITGLVIVAGNVAYLPSFTIAVRGLAEPGRGVQSCEAGALYYSSVNAWYWTNFTLQYGAPLVILTVCSLLLVARLIYNFHEKWIAPATVRDMTKLKTSGITFTFYALAATYILTSLPLCTLDPLIIKNYAQGLPDDLQRARSLVKYAHVAEFFYNLNFVNNIFFCLFINLFRNGFCKLFQRTSIPDSEHTKSSDAKLGNGEKRPTKNGVQYQVKNNTSHHHNKAFEDDTQDSNGHPKKKVVLTGSIGKHSSNTTVTYNLGDDNIFQFHKAFEADMRYTTAMNNLNNAFDTEKQDTKNEHIMNLYKAFEADVQKMAKTHKKHACDSTASTEIQASNSEQHNAENNNTAHHNEAFEGDSHGTQEKQSKDIESNDTNEKEQGGEVQNVEESSDNAHRETAKDKALDTPERLKKDVASSLMY